GTMAWRARFIQLGPNRLETPLIATPSRSAARSGTLPAVNEAIVPGFRYSSKAQELWALMIEGYASWEARMNAVAADAGLSPVSAWALVQLARESTSSQKERDSRRHW